MKNTINWAQKTAVVTGAGSGIGRAIAIALVKKGATVHLVDIHQQRIATMLDDLSRHLNVYGHTVDVTIPEQLGQLAATLPNKVDILINCAGILHQGKIATATNKELHQVLEVNLWGAIYSIKAFLPKMRNKPMRIKQIKNQKYGSHIINIASIAGLIGAPEMAIYNASKSAILGLTDSLTIELAADNIHVAAVCPGSINTNLGRDGKFSSNSTVAQTLRKTIGSGASPDRVAQDILRVIEHSSSFKLSCVELHWQVLWLCKRIFPTCYPKFASTIYRKVFAQGLFDSFLLLKGKVIKGL